MRQSAVRLGVLRGLRRLLILRLCGRNLRRRLGLLCRGRVGAAGEQSRITGNPTLQERRFSGQIGSLRSLLAIDRLGVVPHRLIVPLGDIATVPLVHFGDIIVNLGRGLGLCRLGLSSLGLSHLGLSSGNLCGLGLNRLPLRGLRLWSRGLAGQLLLRLQLLPGHLLLRGLLLGVLLGGAQLLRLHLLLLERESPLAGGYDSRCGRWAILHRDGDGSVRIGV